MATQQNSNLNYTGLVQKYIGSAYDKVAAVGEAIDDVKTVAEVINDGTFQYIIDNIDAISKVVQDIYDFNNIYYGVLDEEPTESPSGEPIDEGDLYYNRIEQQLYIYIGNTVVDECGNIYVEDGRWLPVGAIESTTEHIVITSDQALNGIIELQHPYVPGQNNLDVYVNNIVQMSKTTANPEGNYSETAGNLITFDLDNISDGHGGFNTLAEGDDVYIVIGLNVATVDHNIDVNMGRYITQVANEQIIQLPASEDEPNGMTYIPGSHNLEVYVKDNQHAREIQVVDIDYLEIDFNKIQFITPLPQYSEIIFKKGVVLSNCPLEPTVLMQENKPTEIFYPEGKFWYNTSTGRLSILYLDNDLKQWVDISEEHTVIHADYVAPPAPPPVLTNATLFQPLQPEVDLFAEGTLWFNTSTGELNILYADPGDREGDGDDGGQFGPSPQWVKVSTQ